MIKLPMKADTLKYNVIKSKIGIGAGSAWETWQLMGTPQNLTSAQFELLKRIQLLHILYQI